MADVTVKQFATVVGIPVNRLLEQFTEAGITVAGADATITEKQKVDLLRTCAKVMVTHRLKGRSSRERSRSSARRTVKSE